MKKEKERKIKGYKAFKKGLINIWDKEFEIGKKYIVDSKHQEYNYHFCECLEDVFVFYKESDTQVCEVIGSGNIIKNYNEYYDVGIIASSELEIIRVINREEIINFFLSMTGYYPERIKNFLIRFRLTDNEIKLFINKFQNNQEIINTIKYHYQLDKNIYKRKIKQINK